eukprot:6211794-Pleurochrysis_carterae.AAC.2
MQYFYAVRIHSYCSRYLTVAGEDSLRFPRARPSLASPRQPASFAATAAPRPWRQRGRRCWGPARTGGSLCYPDRAGAQN